MNNDHLKRVRSCHRGIIHSVERLSTMREREKERAFDTIWTKVFTYPKSTGCTKHTFQKFPLFPHSLYCRKIQWQGSRKWTWLGSGGILSNTSRSEDKRKESTREESTREESTYPGYHHKPTSHPRNRRRKPGSEARKKLWWGGSEEMWSSSTWWLWRGNEDMRRNLINKVRRDEKKLLPPFSSCLISSFFLLLPDFFLLSPPAWFLPLVSSSGFFFWWGSLLRSWYCNRSNKKLFVWFLQVAPRKKRNQNKTFSSSISFFQVWVSVLMKELVKRRKLESRSKSGDERE